MTQMNEVNSLNRVIVAIHIYDTVDTRYMADVLYADGYIDSKCWNDYYERSNILSMMNSRTRIIDSRSPNQRFEDYVRIFNIKGENTHD